jgi:hypothetical protein
MLGAGRALGSSISSPPSQHGATIFSSFDRLGLRMLASALIGAPSRPSISASVARAAPSAGCCALLYSRTPF